MYSSKGFTIATLLILLAGCASQNEIIAGDGESAFQVDCSGNVKSWDVCYEKIAKTCGAMGYEVIRSSLDGNEIRGKESKNRSILARCKK
jgi:hypothetical protein